MVDAYLSPQLITFINFFYYFTKKIDKDISFCISMLDDFDLQIRLRKGNYNICKCYLQDFVNRTTSIELISKEVQKVVTTLLDEERVGTYGKIET